LPGLVEMVCRQPGSREKRLGAAASPAIAAGARDLLRCRPGQRIVTPFAGDRVGPPEHPSADSDAAADAGTEDHAEHAVEARRGTVDRFRQGEAVGVIGKAYRPAKRSLEISLQRPADQPRGVRVLDQTSCRRNRPGHADPYGGDGARFALQGEHHRRDRRGRRRVIADRCRQAPPQAHRAAGIDHRALDLGTAEIHPDAIPGGHCLSQRRATCTTSITNS
jgi:hypothetical protein